MIALNDVNAALALIEARCGTALRMATPLGLGKPHRLINALYAQVKADPARQLQIFTALSLNPPRGRSDLERRFLQPFTDRVYTPAFPRLAYVDDRDRDQLPANVQVEEFYMQSGAMLHSLQAQSHYASLNYTHVARALASRGLNLIVQKIATDGQGRYSLSCNTDLTEDILAAMAQRGLPRPLLVGEIDPQLPFMAGTAEVEAGFFDAVLELPPPHTPLFALPRQGVSDADYAIGLRASALVKDGGTLQIGIGALADALSHALVLRHTRNAEYRQVLAALDPALVGPDGQGDTLVQAVGGLGPFEQGLYGCSEMVNEGFRLLAEHGILKRRVVEDVAVLRRLAAGTDSEADRALVAQTGQFLHGGFYLGSADFYDWVRRMAREPNTLGMQRISLINEISGPDFEREALQRRHARFFNTCMMATVLGGAASETLADGRVVSGVGGQYNFVSMGHSLPEARSVLMLRAARSVAGRRESNIRTEVASLTIPRHLRDVCVTEYGIADLRDRTDADCIRAMLAVSEAAFQPGLLQAAQAARKLPAQDTLPATGHANTPARLREVLRPFRRSGLLPDYPLGSDFTPVEQHLVRALGWLKENTDTRWEKARTLLDTALDLIREPQPSPEVQAALQRMGLDAPEGAEQKLLAELLEKALRETASAG